MTTPMKWILALSAICIALFIAYQSFQGSAPKPDAPVAKTTAAKSAPMPTRASTKAEAKAAPELRPAFLDDDPVGSIVLEGQVIDEEGRPVAGALVHLASAPSRETTSAEDGSFTFKDLVPRRYALFARSPDRVGGPMMVGLTESSDPVILIVRAGGGLEVSVVRSDDSPIAGATVTLGASTEVNAQTNAEGIAILRNLPSGQRIVYANAPGFSRTQSLVNVPSSQVLGKQRLVLVPGVAVSGVVEDHQGKPVADARVIAQEVGSFLATEDPRTDGIRTDKDGRFTLSAVKSGHVQLVAWHEEHAPSTSAMFQVSDSPIDDARVVMKQGALLSGVVTDAVGETVPWVSVRVIGNSVNRQVIADDDGVFSLRGLPRESLTLHAFSELASSEGLEVDLQDKSRAVELRLILNIEGILAGIVVDESGEPVAETQVTATPDFWEGGDIKQLRVRGAVTATTAGDGSFTIGGLPDSKYRVRASRDEGRFGGGWGQGVPAQTGDRNLRVVLATPGSITGTVVASDGSTPGIATASIGWGAGVPAMDGEFRLNDVVPGTYEVAIKGPGFADTFVAKVEVKAGTDVDLGNISVVKGRAVFGRITDASGQAVSNAEVVLARQLLSDGKNLTPKDLGGALDTSLGLRRTRSDDDGSYRLDGIGVGEWTLAADHPETGRSLGVKVVSQADDAEINLQLQAVASLRGTVSLNGKPQPDVQVLIASTKGGAHIVVVKSDANGEFFAERVAIGPHKVSAMLGAMGGSSMAATTLDVQEKKDNEVKLNVEEGSVTLNITVNGEAGVTIDASQIFLFEGAASIKTGSELNELFLNSASSAKMAFAFADGKAAFEKVLPGRYSVCVIPINGDMNDPSFATKLQRNVSKLAVYCHQTDVPESPQTKSFALEVPAMSPLPED